MKNTFNLTLRVTWWMQIIQILFAIPFTIGAIYSLVLISRGTSICLVAFFICVFLAYLGFANAFSTIKITDESVVVTVFYGRFCIGWKEVNTIAQNNPFIALIGNDKRVVISLAFAGKDSNKMLEFFNQQAETYNIIFEENASFPITHQNARVWR